MKKTIALKINLSKIDKDRLYKGNKGTYLNAIYKYDSENDQYDNNGMIVQSVSKEERDKGIQGEILGNGKIVWSEEPATEPASGGTVDIDDSSDLPF